MSMDDAAKAASTDPLALTFAAWLTRLWLGVRAVQTGIEKYAGTTVSDQAVEIDGQPNDYGLSSATAEKTYGLEHYHGVPAAMRESFEKEPLMPGFLLGPYDKLLGPLLIALGLTILLGIVPRTSLFLLGLLYISLTWGLILLGQPGQAGVAWLGVHLVLIVLALKLSPHNRLCAFGKW